MGIKTLKSSCNKNNGVRNRYAGTFLKKINKQTKNSCITWNILKHFLKISHTLHYEKYFGKASVTFI